MSFCGHCGAQVPDGAAFCPVCGAAAGPSGGADWRADSASDAENNKGLCVLCYLGPLFLIPYFARRGSPFVSFHANQGLVLFLFEILASIASSVPFLGWIIRIICGIYIFVCFIMGIVNVCNGEMKPLPMIGGISILKQN